MTSDPNYANTGVDATAAQRGLSSLARHIRGTLRLRDDAATGRPVRGLGYYANVVDIGGGRGLALCADGVGTKILVAEIMGRYDGIAIDCIAMNVNDLICVGADPIALLDYIAVGRIDDGVFDQIGRGFAEGCARCGITIPGGEIAQVREMLRGEGPTEGLDLVGTAVGLVPLDRVLFGQDVRPGDVVLGLASSGIHSNGFTLARRVLAPSRDALHRHEAALGRTLGEELLVPTELYVQFARALFASQVATHALCHITGDGFANLTRVEAKVGFLLDALPPPPPIFRLIQERGRVSDAEMYSVYNMGVGLCVIVPPTDADAVLRLAAQHGHSATRIGTVTDEVGVVHMPQYGLTKREGSLKQV